MITPTELIRRCIGSIWEWIRLRSYSQGDSLSRTSESEELEWIEFSLTDSRERSREDWPLHPLLVLPYYLLISPSGQLRGLSGCCCWYKTNSSFCLSLTSLAWFNQPFIPSRILCYTPYTTYSECLALLTNSLLPPLLHQTDLVALPLSTQQTNQHSYPPWHKN